MKRNFLAILMITATFVAHSQERPQVKATITPDSMMIGDHFSLRVELTKDMMQVVDFPTFENGELAKSIEILAETNIDTIAKEGRNITLGKSYTLTCFDEGNYTLAPFPALYIDKNIVDTIWSADSLKFAIHTMAIDTTTQTIYDIKQPLGAPLRFGEISGYILWGALAGLILAAIIYIIIRKLKNKPLINSSSVTLPPHVAAIQQLEKLHSQKLWQSGKHKQYYTAITDILRVYIEQRYGVAAMEMTSAELLNALSSIEITDGTTLKLKEILLASDFVKFAKYVPDNQTNERVYLDAYYFVEDTKLIDSIEHDSTDSVDNQTSELINEEGTK